MKSNKHIISFVNLIFSMCFLYLFSQADLYASDKNQSQTINQDYNLKNEHEKKFGFWIEDDAEEELYYKNGVRDGIYKRYYSPNGKLLFFGEYKNGHRVGLWYFFHQDGYLILTEKEIAKNTNLTVRRDDGVRIMPANRSYVTEYYSNGMVKDEGLALYDDDVVIYFFKKGKWKYYKPSGELERTERN